MGGGNGLGAWRYLLHCDNEQLERINTWLGKPWMETRYKSTGNTLSNSSCRMTSWTKFLSSTQEMVRTETAFFGPPHPVRVGPTYRQPSTRSRFTIDQGYLKSMPDAFLRVSSLLVGYDVGRWLRVSEALGNGALKRTSDACPVTRRNSWRSSSC